MDITYSAKWNLTDEQLKDVEPLVDYARDYVLSELVQALEAEALMELGIFVAGEITGNPTITLGEAED